MIQSIPADADPFGSGDLGMTYTGRTRRRWFFFTQYEYEFRAWTGGRWQTPYNSDKWPLALAWTYSRPEWRNSVGLIDRMHGRA